MTEKSKFSGALAQLSRPAAQPVAALDVSVPATPSASSQDTEKGRGRPHGKRSDPAYQATTVLLRKQTKKAATRQLQDSDSNLDLSDLIEQLLSEWIKKSV